jgi:mannose-1-phosphate guanylyltransferase
MSHQTIPLHHLWSVILAGGEGIRLKPMIEQWKGRHIPKQYCAFMGKRSMLTHTLERAAALTPGNQTVTVLSRNHRCDAWSSFEGIGNGTIVLQPENRDTAAGIFLPLTYVRAKNPQATVVIYPSDHFIYPNYPFIETVRNATLASKALPDKMLLLGAQPESPEQEYGWIHLGSQLLEHDTLPIWSVQSFIEKPQPKEAKKAYENGALWNTLVLIGNLENLWSLGRHFFPDLISLFEQFQEVIGTTAESAMLEWIYKVMPVHNFSHDFLQRAPEHIAVIPLEGVYWSDWGNPERILRTIKWIGKTPAFPLTLVQNKKDVIHSYSLRREHQPEFLTTSTWGRTP